VGYKRDLIGNYQPNGTFYLSEITRKHLLEIGQSQIGVLPAGTYALQIYNKLLIDLTWNSSRLEGNTYSLLETERLIELGESAEGKDALETQMILNHKAAVELLVESAADTGFNHYTICNLHALLSENLLPDPAACGRLRQHSVGIDGSVFHPLQGGALIKECFDEVLRKANAIEDPFEQAFFTMVQLPYLQPFDDVNKRVSRLAANIPFIRDNLSPLSFVDVPEKAYIDGLLGIYELNRTDLLADVFVWAYERSCARYSAVRQSLGEPDPFRLRYRELIAQLVSNIVIAAMDKKTAISSIKQFARKEVTEHDRTHFMAMVETELMGLHEGNIARYRLRPSAFENWKRQWN
jgi:Fic family protein